MLPARFHHELRSLELLLKRLAESRQLLRLQNSRSTAEDVHLKRPLRPHPGIWLIGGMLAKGATYLRHHRDHLHELRIELTEDFDQIGLRSHDGVDVLIIPRAA